MANEPNYKKDVLSYSTPLAKLLELKVIDPSNFDLSEPLASSLENRKKPNNRMAMWIKPHNICLPTIGSISFVGFMFP